MSTIANFDLIGFTKRLSDLNRAVFENYLKNISGYHEDTRDIALTYLNYFTTLFMNPGEIARVESLYTDYFQKQQQLFTSFLSAVPNNTHHTASHHGEDDRRFSAPEWKEYPFYDLIKQSYLLMEHLGEKLADVSEMDEKQKNRLKFYNNHYLDALSPANFLFTNPEALNLAFDTKGKSLWDGFNNLVDDIERGKIAQTDEAAFVVGKNLAITPGSVIYQNELIQLIEYTPTKAHTREIPMLLVPSWINKYYVFDLQAHNSFVKFLLDQGIPVLVISWRNPTPDMGKLSFDDYVREGALKAIEVAADISPTKKINVLGYCLGGTLLGVALSILCAKKKDPIINTVTFLASMIDFSDIGPMGDVINESLIRKVESGELTPDGILHGHDMERAFNLIRANDLVWKFVVHNYLKGLTPGAFDVLYWTNDNTNLPANMYIYYMRNMIFDNKLSRKNALTICDTNIDVGKINCPVFVIAFSEDYISPPKTCYETNKLVSGPVEFIYGGSGHVMGAINPPAKNKYGYYLNGNLEGDFENWKKTAQHSDGSWWTPWSERILANSGNEIPAKTTCGNETYRPLEPAPGKYVTELCHQCMKRKIRNSKRNYPIT